MLCINFYLAVCDLKRLALSTANGWLHAVSSGVTTGSRDAAPNLPETNFQL